MERKVQVNPTSKHQCERQVKVCQVICAASVNKEKVYECVAGGFRERYTEKVAQFCAAVRVFPMWKTSRTHKDATVRQNK